MFVIRSWLQAKIEREIAQCLETLLSQADITEARRDVARLGELHAEHVRVVESVAHSKVLDLPKLHQWTRFVGCRNGAVGSDLSMRSVNESTRASSVGDALFSTITGAAYRTCSAMWRNSSFAFRAS